MLDTVFNRECVKLNLEGTSKTAVFGAALHDFEV
jgi:hypothetical protein